MNIKELENKLLSIQGTIEIDKDRKNNIDKFINTRCNHLEHYEEEYDDYHRWGTDYFCIICRRHISKKKPEYKTDTERENSENTWKLMKNMHNDRSDIENTIKYNEYIIKNIQSLIKFRTNSINLNNGCPHDVMIRHIAAETYAMFYKCTLCEYIDYVII